MTIDKIGKIPPIDFDLRDQPNHEEPDKNPNNTEPEIALPEKPDYTDEQLKKVAEESNFQEVETSESNDATKEMELEIIRRRLKNLRS